MEKYQFIKLDGTIVSEYDTIDEVNNELQSIQGLDHYWFDTDLVENLNTLFGESPKLQQVVIIKKIEE